MDGSPPRAWGQRVGRQLGAVVLRFTPTGVGTTVGGRISHVIVTVHPHGRGDNAQPPPPVSWTITVHPHGRGDNHLSPRFSVICHGSPPRAWGQRRWPVAGGLRGGSPPRAWGQRCGCCAPAVVARFTPTGVGTTRRWPVAGGLQGGSPPRAWGQRLPSAGTLGSARFTPTGVGTTDMSDNCAFSFAC